MTFSSNSSRRMAFQFDDAGCVLAVSLGSTSISLDRAVSDGRGVLFVLLHKVHQLLELNSQLDVDGHRSDTRIRLI